MILEVDKSLFKREGKLFFKNHSQTVIFSCSFGFSGQSTFSKQLSRFHLVSVSEIESEGKGNGGRLLFCLAPV